MMEQGKDKALHGSSGHAAGMVLALHRRLHAKGHRLGWPCPAVSSRVRVQHTAIRSEQVEEYSSAARVAAVQVVIRKTACQWP